MRKIFIVLEDCKVQSIFADAKETVEIVVIDRTPTNFPFGDPVGEQAERDRSKKEEDLVRHLHDLKDVRQIY